jgi:hypothetical protein
MRRYPVTALGLSVVLISGCRQGNQESGLPALEKRVTALESKLGQAAQPGVLRAGGYTIQFGTQVKTQPRQTIVFPHPFSSAPHVMISPSYDADAQVGSIEAIRSVQPGSFDVWGQNVIPQYSVHWIAIGE